MPDFVIPVARSDLLKRTTPNSYVVNEIVSVRQLRNQLPKCHTILTTEGHVYILRAFDLLFSVLHEWNNISSSIKEEAWEIILKGCELCVRQLASVLERGEGGSLNVDRFEAASHRNALKMHVYLCCQFVDMFENELNANAKSNAAIKVGRQKGRGGGSSRGTNRATSAAATRLESGSTDTSLTIDWITECEKAVSVLDQLCRLQLNKLWDPPVVEEDFISLSANCCYKLLENRSMASSADVRAAITSLLTTLVRRYGHSITCCVKLTQLLQCFPHMVNCLLSLVRSFMKEDHMIGVVRELLKEICSYNGADLERDAQATQNFSSFLLDVAAAFPGLAQSILPLLRPRLDEDPYQMRNCVLGVIGEILSSFASREQLDPKESIQRERLMDLLQEHIHDVNGYVRAKALQLWHGIVSTRGLPVRRQSQLAKLLVGPLGAMMDVSSFARRYACKTLTAMVLQSPAAKLTPDALQRVLKKEMKRLDGLEELLGKICPYDDPGDADMPVLDQEAQGSVTDVTAVPKKKVCSHKHPRHHARRTLDDDSVHGEQDRELSDCVDSRCSVTESLCSDEVLEGPPPIDGAESNAITALEAAIHSAAVIASQPTGTPQRTPHRSTTFAHAELSAEVQRQRACVAYLRETSEFSALIHIAIRDFQALLASKTLTDVTEAIDFFVTAKHAGVCGLDSGIQQIFLQIWSQDEPIRKAVVESFRRLYLQLDPDEPLALGSDIQTDTADVIVTNLSHLMYNADMGTLVSVERIIRELAQSDQLNPKLICHFWRRFADSAKLNTPESIKDVKSMLLILKMMVKSESKEFEEHLDSLLRYGLDTASEPAKVDLERVTFTCDVLQRMVPRAKTDKTGNNASKCAMEPFRLAANHPLFIRLRSILISTACQSQQSMWIPMMEQAIGTIYDLSESPELTVMNVISSIAEKVVKQALKSTEQSLQMQPTTDRTSICPSDPNAIADDEVANLLIKIKDDPEAFVQRSNLTCSSIVLSRFLSLVGHACLKHLVYMEYHVLNEMKRRAALKEERESKAKRTSRRNPRHSRISTASFASSSTLNATTVTASAAADEETGLVGVAADDAEADCIRHICDTGFLSAPNHFFHPLLNMVTYVCSHPSEFPSDTVLASASLSLAKMMLVNAEVCEPRLQLLFTLAERSTSEIVRANLIVALGDLCRRFPNLLEPWTPNLYARLRDSSAKVRTNALHTLSHLILNDMVKVKGQISEMTVCLVDEIDRLNVLARQFFTELAQKGTALYNVVPDIISRLSDPDIGVSEEHFHSIMEFLLPLIGRERLCETLVEKICSRFRATSLHRQWRDLAFCLTVISFNERCMRVLYENLPSFADKLCLSEVYAAFEMLLSNAKKFTKPDGMARLEEFEAKINEFHQKGVADEEALRRAEVAAKATKRRSRHPRTPAGEVTRRNIRRARPLGPSVEPDIDVTEGESTPTNKEPVVAPKNRRGPAINDGRVMRSRRKNRVVFSSDEETSEPSDEGVDS